jgi:hypothetical protein
MPHLVCITGRARHEEKAVGREWCQECNRYHDRKEIRLPDIPQHIEECLVSARSVAIMLRDDEITIHDAVKTLLILTEPPYRSHPHKRD